MKKQKKNLDAQAELRLKAEDLLKKKSINPSVNQTVSGTEADALKLIHELEVRQIELNMMMDELELAKKQNEDLNKSLFQANHSIMMMIDPETGKIKDANTAACKFYGWTNTEMCSKNISDINPLSKAEMSIEMQKARQEKRNHFLFKHILANGELRDVEVFSSPVSAGNTTLLHSIVHDLTERITTEEKLRKSEEKYRNLVESISDVVYEITVTGIIKYVSRSSINVLGYAPEEVIGKNILNFIHPDDQLMIAGRLSTLKLKDYNFLEYRYINKSGEICWVRSSTNAVVENGIIIGGAGTLTDITERRLAEAAIFESEEKYSRIFDTSPYAIMVTDAIDSKIIEVNKAFTAISGYTREEAVGDSTIGLKLWAKMEDRNRVISELVEGKELTAEEFLFLTKSGKTITAQFSAQSIQLANRLYILSSIDDITERKLAESALRESESLYKAILNTSPDNITITDLNGTILISSSKALTMFGYESMEHLIGHNLNEYIVAGDRDRAITEIGKMHQGILTGPANYKAVHADNTIFDIEVNGEMMRDNDGTPTRMVFVVRDVSERLKAEQIIKESEKKFQAIIQSQSEGIGVVNEHEVFDFANLAASKIFETDQLIGLSLYDFLSPGEKERINQQTQSRQNGISNNYELRIKTPKGNDKYISISCSPRLDENGNYTGAYGVFHDVTDQKLAQDEIKNKTTLLTNLIINLEEGILLESADRKILMTNQLFCDMFAIPAPPAALIGADCSDSAEQSKMLFQNPDSFVAEINKILADKKIILDFELKLADGRYFERDYIPTYIENTYSGHLWKYRDITDRKVTENQIRLSEEKFRSITEQTSDLIAIADENGIITYASSASDSIFHISPEKIVGRNFISFVAETDITRAIQAFGDCMNKDGGIKNAEFLMKRDDGSTFFGELNGSKFQSATQLGTLVTIRDVSERKGIEEELIKLSKAVDQSPAMICITDLDGNIQYANSKSVELTGFTQQEMIGKNPRLFSSGETTREEYQILWDKLKSGKEWRGEFHNKKKNGELFWSAASLSPIFDNDGKMTHFLAIQEDITQRKSAEDQLRRSEEKYRNIFESIQDVYFEASFDGILLEISPSIEALTKGQYTRAEMVGKPFAGIYADIDERNAYISTLVEQKRVTDQELSLLNKDGSIICISVTSAISFDSDGKPVKTTGIFRDITERKQAELKINDLNENLEKRIIERTAQLVSTNEILENEIQRRVLAEEELELKKQRLSDIIAGTNVGTWEWNIQTGETIFNDRWFEMIGYTLDELSPVNIETWIEFIHPDDLQKAFELQEKHFKREVDYFTLEFRMKHKDGSWTWVLNNGKAHTWDDSGKPLLMSGTHQDITLRKQAEEQLLWNKTLLELMSNSSPLGFLVADNRSDAILYFNHRFCEIWEIQNIEEQMQRGELTNNGIIPYCLPVLADKPAFAESCKTLQEETNRVVVEDEIAFTENRTVRRFTTQIRGKNDEYYGRLYIFEDITQRKRTSEFETELLQLSLQLTGIPNAEIPAALNLALNKIGGFLGADRAYIFETDLPKNTMNNTFEWCNTGIEPEIQHLKNLASDHLPMWWEIMKRNEIMIIPSVQDLPDTWQTERGHLEQQGIQSLLAIPMLIENNLIGFVGLDSVTNKREYTGSEINMLTVWSNMLASLLNHRRQEEFIEQTRQNYETFFNTIDDFLFVLDQEGNILHTNSTVINRLGYTAEQLLGLSVLMVHPAERRQEAGRIVGEMLAGTADFCPVPLVTKAGNLISVETRVKPGYWDGKAVIFGVTKDVSAIKLSEEKFSKAFQANSAYMAISQISTGKFIEVNDSFIKGLEYSREEISGKSSVELNLYHDPEQRKKIVKEHNQFEPVRDLEIEVQTKSGKIKTGLFSADLIYIGQEPCLLTIMIDITERKKAELALKESESRFSLFMDYLPAVVFLKDQDGRTLFVNKYMQDAFGASAWVGKTMMEVFPNELGEKLTSDDLNSMALGYIKIEEELVQLDGKLHHYETQKFTIGRLGQEPWLGGISLDITQRKKAEVELLESREQLELVIKGSNDAPWDWDLVKDQLFYSIKWWQQLGYTPDEIPSDSSLWRNLTHPDDAEHVTNVFEKALESKNDSYECEFGLLHKNGYYVPVLSRGFITRDNTGKAIRVTGTNMDLTERKNAETEVLKAKNEAVKANQAKSEFLSRMSHELRTPMNSILGFAQLLEMDELSPKQKKGVNHILNSGKHLLKLIDEVLDISRIEAGKLIISHETVQVGRIITEMLDSIQPLIASRQIKMQLINTSDGEQYIIADRQRLKQVLLNLLVNAVKYNREGGTISISNSVILQSEGDDASVRISISDSGNGISEEDIPKIFLPFERIGAEKTKTEGTGLGLAVAKKFMEAMDGNIGVKSEPGKGSTFWIELPLAGNIKSRKQLNEENIKLTGELGAANKEIGFQHKEKTKRADELKVANTELTFQNEEKSKRADELKDAREEIDFLTNQNREQATELGNANKELSLRKAAQAKTDGAKFAKTWTILYIEDNESNIELVQQILANQRPDIRLVSHMTGKDSVSKAIDCAADLILLDLDLPDSHGSEVLEWLKADEIAKNIPVVIVSADAIPQQAEKLLKSGAKKYFTKPLDLIDFLKVVDEWLK
jgi:PAS domain S-box-containing protein